MSKVYQCVAKKTIAFSQKKSAKFKEGNVYLYTVEEASGYRPEIVTISYSRYVNISLTRLNFPNFFTEIDEYRDIQLSKLLK